MTTWFSPVRGPALQSRSARLAARVRAFLSALRGPRPEPASRAYEYLARRIERSYARTGQAVVIAFCCPDGDAPAAGVVLMQAHALRAELEVPVLVVDARLAELGAGVTQRLALDGRPGYADLLRNAGAEVEPMVQRCGAAGVDVLPMGVRPDARAAALQECLAHLLAWARSRYGYVLLQVGPVTADTRNLLTAVQADGVVLVAEEHRTMMAVIEASQDLLRTHGAADVRSLLVEDSA